MTDEQSAENLPAEVAAQDLSVLDREWQAHQYEVLRPFLARLCRCDPNPEITEGVLAECPLHGDPDVAGPRLEAAVAFYERYFRVDEYEAGARWGREVASQPADLADERVRAQAGHYASRANWEATALSRCLGRLAGYREAVAERRDEAPPRRRRLPEFRLISEDGS